MAALSATALRSQLYRVLDEVLATGVPAVIERKGRTLRIVADASPARLSALVARPDYLACDPDEIVHLDWSDTWRP